MTSADPKKSNLALRPEDAKAMENYGITRVPVDYFHFGEFRYANLNDAVAEAKRQRKDK